MQCGIRIWVMLIALTLAALACDLSVGGPTPPGSPIPVSTEAAGQMTELWKNAIASASGGEVSVVVTEEQLTSYLDLKLQEQTDPPLQNVQVYLRDSKVQIYGTAKASNVSTTALVTLAVTITEDGNAQFAIEKADFGPVPVPKELLNNLSVALNEAFTGKIGSLATGIKIKSVLIADGNMGIVGAIR